MSAAAGSLLRSKRLDAKLSQAEVARRAGISQAAVSDYESARRDPRLGTILALCEALEISPTEIVGAFADAYGVRVRTRRGEGARSAPINTRAAESEVPREAVDVLDAIRSTRAMRYLRPDPIPEKILWEIIDAATCGPTAGNQQHWGWVIVRDAATKRRIAGWYREGFMLNYGHRGHELRDAHASSGLTGPNFVGSEYLAMHIAEAPVWVVPVLRRTADAQSPLSGGSIYGAVQNLMLAARAYGIGSTLTLNYARHEDDVRVLLGLPDDARTFGIIPLGYPAQGTFGRPRRLPVGSVTHWERWGRLRERPA